MRHLIEKERSDETMDFLNDIIAVCIKHNKILEHEDYHGSFIVAPLLETENFRWLSGAMEEIEDDE